MTKMKLTLILLSVIAGFLATDVLFGQTRAKITAGSPSAGDLFGDCVAIAGDTVVVGVPSDDDPGTGSGSVYVFHRNVNMWPQIDWFRSNEWQNGALFGQAVSISGTDIAVGAPFDIIGGLITGSVEVCQRTDIGWGLGQLLTAADAAEGDYFGEKVCISGNDIIVGARGNDDSGPRSGSAYIFHRSGTVWTQQAKLVANDAAAEDWFGNSVSISGEYAIVGARFDDDRGDTSGSAYIFHRSGAVWTQQAKLVVSDGARGDQFGMSVSINGDYAAVGAWFDDDGGDKSGSVYIFHRSGSTWTQLAKITAMDAAAGDRFGESVKLDGNSLIVGAPFGNAGCGAAYVFYHWQGNWVQRYRLTAYQPVINDYFGWSVDISSDCAVVGASGDDDAGSESGSAYVFRPVTSIEDNPFPLPSSPVIFPNYPNPFNGRTSISFALPQDSHVNLRVYDLLGRSVATLIDNDLQAGYHDIAWDAKDQPSGVYFYQITAGEFAETRKLLLLK
jgi:hypothetical protein